MVLAGAVTLACAAGPGGAGDVERAGRDVTAQNRDGVRAEVRFPRGRVWAAEIADTPDRRARGYMFRREIGEDDAMIFVFPDDDFNSFWMKNTLVPLDMIWMDDDFTVIHIEALAPPCKADPCPGFGPPRKSRYVLEVKGGMAGREGLKVGDRLRISFPEAR
jgi:hypothetical protein